MHKDQKKKTPKSRADKIEDRFYKILISAGVAFLLYTVIPMENRLVKKIDRVEEKQDQITQHYIQCNDKFTQLEKDQNDKLNKEISSLKDWVLAMISRLK